MNNRKIRRMLGIILATMCMVSMLASTSFAYIERGDVKISGRYAYYITPGEKVELEVTPYEEDHYPGCGMAECPKICGEKDCIVIGPEGQIECVCAGTEYVTYYAEVDVKSSDSNVAEVSYSEGTITITGKAAGTASITINAMFREYTDASRVVNIEVGGEEKPGETPEPIEFSDVSGWATDYIYYMADRGVVVGKGENKFAPEDNVTRAEFVKMISGVAKANVKDLQGVSSFSDVLSSAWYAPYVEWASENGVVYGNAGKFSPSDQITRQDMAVIINRYNDKLAVKKLESVNEPITFDDEKNVSDYALSAVKKMQEYGIINGRGNGQFAPKDFATRAEACTMLAKVMQQDEK